MSSSITVEENVNGRLLYDSASLKTEPKNQHQPMHLQYPNQQISRFERNYEPMDLTIKHIRGAIPKRLFARNTDMSMIYRVHDLVMMASIFYGATWVDTSLPSPELKASVW
ncbi:hypothetical protein BGZ52_009967, partial [Haplosporangium bisporale]